MKLWTEWQIWKKREGNKIKKESSRKSSKQIRLNTFGSFGKTNNLTNDFTLAHRMRRVSFECVSFMLLKWWFYFNELHSTQHTNCTIFGCAYVKCVLLCLRVRVRVLLVYAVHVFPYLNSSLIMNHHAINTNYCLYLCTNLLLLLLLILCYQLSLTHLCVSVFFFSTRLCKSIYLFSCSCKYFHYRL